MKKKHIGILLILIIALANRLAAQYIAPQYKNKPVFYPLKYGDVNPAGWLKDWCITAKNGLVLHNPAFREGWINGHPPTFLNEQSAYWIDGMMRLGFILNDQQLIQTASTDIKSVIRNNYLSPSSWATAVYARAVLAYYYGTKDPVALEYLLSFFKSANVYGFSDVVAMKAPNDPRGEFLATTQPRNLVQVEPMLETYILTGNDTILHKALAGLDFYAKRFVEHWLATNIEQLNMRGCYAGMDSAIFKTLPPYKDAFMACLPAMHGVSFNEFAKLWAIGYLFNGNNDYLKASVNAYAQIDSLHMMSYGVNSSWENLMGISPELGTETCNISDFINSNIWLYRITGDAVYGDKIEKAFFNAAPAAVDSGFQHLVYLQSANEVKQDDKFAYKEVHDPMCCNGNVARMLPNYILHMVMATADNGLAVNMYGPCKVNTLINNQTIMFKVLTKYPFKHDVTIKFDQKQAVLFPLYLRVPSWCNAFEVYLNGKKIPANLRNGFLNLNRFWKLNDEVTLKFQTEIKVKDGITRSNGAVSSLTGADVAVAGKPYSTVEYGPLLFALDLSTGSRYNYSLADEHFKVKYSGSGKSFNWKQPPVTIVADLIETDWKNAPALPASIKKNGDAIEKMILIPYGSTTGQKISVFPFYKAD
ncbi:beta-L-arabinofuranosidase domain-containing protein [Niabella aquatica]